MKILTKKIFREMKENKFRSLSIIIIIALTVMLLAGLRASHPVLFNTYELNQRYYDVADGTFTFSEPMELNNVTAIKNNIEFMDQNNIANIEGRIHYLTEITFKGEKFQAVIFGIDYPNEVNQLVIEKSATDIDNEKHILQSNSSCLVETHFAGGLFGQGVELDDQIEVRFPDSEMNFTVKGIAQDSYYSYMVDEASNMPLLGNLAVIWMNIQIAQQLRYEGNPLINQVLFTVEDRLNKDQILTAADALSYFFGNHNIPANAMKFVVFDETDEYNMFIGDAGAVDKMGTIFGIIGLIICIVIIFNTLNKMVYAQRKNIGIFLAMGSSKRKILFHFAGFTLILTISGIIIGIPLAFGLAIGMSQMVVGKLYGFHQIDLSIPAMEFVYAGVITLCTCITCSILSAWTITKATPREAMAASFTRIKKVSKTFAEKIFGWIPMFKPIHMIVPLREVFLKKKKSLITILALITSMIFLVNSLAMVYNIFDIMIVNFDEYNTYDVQIILENPVHIDYINQFMKNDSIEALKDIDQHEIFIDVYTKIIHNGELLSWTELVCYQENSSLRSFNIIEGSITQKSDLSNSTILLGNAIAGKYDLGLHDEIEVGILGNYSVEIVGLVGELIDYSVLWTYEAFQESGVSLYFGLLNNWVNGIIFDVNENANLNKIRDEFEKQFEIAFWIESETAKEATLAFMEAMLGMMIVLLGVGLLISILFSFQSMYVAFMDRQQDFLSLKAMGTKNKHIRRIVFWENAILSFFSLILTIPIGYLTYWWTLDYMLEDKFYMPTSIPWFAWPSVLILSLLALWLATSRLLRKIKKMKLANELRQTGAI
ncbi:MAG: FtsX-like permease family protein [Asgard group archaeon]|nr:FtsX-like permease family protein [Asgard group archaeon]